MSRKSKKVTSLPVEKQELNITVYNLQEYILKLCNRLEKLDMTVLQNIKQCDIVDLSWLMEEKCKMIDNIKNNLENLETNLEMTEGEKLIEVYNTLVQENNEQDEIVELLTEELYIMEKKLNEMKEIARLWEMNQDKEEKIKKQCPEELDINHLSQKSGQKLHEMRNILLGLLDSCYNTRIKKLIQNLTNAYFQGGDNKYIDLNESGKYSMSDINLLKKTGLIVEDPYNSMRIKFTDLE